MTMNPKNRKLLWAAGAMLAALYFVPSAIESYRAAALYRQRMANAQTGRAAPAIPGQAPAAGIPASASASPASTANPRANTLVGIWEAQQAQANREVCLLALELRENTPGQLTGYAKLTCWPLIPNVAGQPNVNPVTNVVRSLSPIAAVLTGSLKDGVVAFHVDRTIGATVEGCQVTAFTVTPFGNDQIAAQWQDGACGTGQMVLRRAGR